MAAIVEVPDQCGEISTILDVGDVVLLSLHLTTEDFLPQNLNQKSLLPQAQNPRGKVKLQE